jgi:multidrug resistance efflux pump
MPMFAQLPKEATMSEETLKPAKPAPSRPLKPIPIPLWVRWQEFRIMVLPTMIFLIVAVACVLMWSKAAVNSGASGIAEGVRSTVTTPRPATVQSILVKPYEMVKEGDPVAIVLPVDPGAELDLLQSELNLARIGLQPSLGDENVMNFEQIRVDLLRTKSELAIAKVNLERTENQVNRHAPLYLEKLISEDIFDLAVKTRDAFAAEVFEKSNAVIQIEKRLDELQAFGLPQGTNSLAAATLARLNILRQQISTNWMPITLRASISGMVSAVGHQPGENALEGEPIVTISATKADRVIGYLRQPYPVDPQVGMEVEMITRDKKSRRLSGVITQVGAQMEIITNSLAIVRVGVLVDSGLPVAISLPPGATVRPGEVLDLNFRQTMATIETPAEDIAPSVDLQSSEPKHAAAK